MIYLSLAVFVDSVRVYCSARISFEDRTMRNHAAWARAVASCRANVLPRRSLSQNAVDISRQVERCLLRESNPPIGNIPRASVIRHRAESHRNDRASRRVEAKSGCVRHIHAIYRKREINERFLPFHCKSFSLGALERVTSMSARSLRTRMAFFFYHGEASSFPRPLSITPRTRSWGSNRISSLGIWHHMVRFG